MAADNRHIGSLVFLISTILLSFTAKAQLSPDLHFQNMDILGNLSNNFVNDIAQDSLGFIWIATNDGLCRYDSPQTIKVFKNGDIGLQANVIRTIEGGRDNHLLIGTSFGGLTRYNVTTNESTTYSIDGARSTQLSSPEVLSIAETSLSEIWVGTESGLDVIYPDQDSIYNFNPLDDPLSVIPGAVLDILVDDKGWIWITTWDKGMYLYLPHKSGKHTKGSFRKLDIDALEGKDNIWEIVSSDDSHYWLATHNGGLVYMQLPDDATNQSDKQDWQPTYKIYNTSNTNISLDYLTDIALDEDHNLWIATSNGLNVIHSSEIKAIDFSQESQQANFFNFFQQPRSKYSINDNSVTSLQLDKQGLVWIGSTSGINQYNKLNNRFNKILISDYLPEENNQYDRVNIIKQLDKNTLILGTSMNGVLCFDIQKNQVVSRPMFEGIFDNKRISAIHGYQNEFIYVGTEDGFCRVSTTPPYDVVEFNFNQATQKEKAASSTTDEKTFFKTTAIYKDSKGRVWAGSESVLYKVDETSKEWLTTAADNSVTKIIEDSEQNIWAITYRGIFKIYGENGDETYQKFTRGDSIAGDIMLSNQIITCQEYDKTIYFGALSGIFTYDLREEKFKPLENSSKYSINSMAITDEGIIWASTPNGIYRYDIHQKNETLFSEKDGLQMISFRDEATFAGQDGDVFFGCQEGLIKINESHWEEHIMDPNVTITEVSTMNPDTTHLIHVVENEGISVAPDNMSFRIRYASSNYSQPSSNIYAYRLEGFAGEEWTYTDQEEITYTNLDPGKYKFMIKTACQKGIWPEHYSTLDIKVEPNFAETLMFKVLLALLAIGLMILVIYSYSRVQHKRHKLLSDYNKRLNHQIRKTESANQSLADRDIKLQELINKLDESNKELKRSNKDLEQFAYIASHDLQEPLRTVSAFVDILGKKTELSKDEDTKHITGYISQGVNRMSSLIHSLLMFSLIGKEGQIFEKVNLGVILEDKVNDLDRYIKENNAKIIIHDLPSIVCRKEEVATVFYNLILNGLKFNKSPEPTVEVWHEELKDHWEFHIKDNGIGIPEKYQAQIFEIFKRLHGKGDYEGTGIGLAVCNKVISKHDGQLRVRSAADKGSTFSFTISKHLEAAPVELELA